MRSPRAFISKEWTICSIYKRTIIFNQCFVNPGGIENGIQGIRETQNTDLRCDGIGEWQTKLYGQYAHMF